MLVRVNGGNALDASPPPCKWQVSCRHRSAFGVRRGREVALLRLERALGGDRDRDHQQRCPGRPPPAAEKRALDRQPRPQPRHAARTPHIPVDDAMKLPDALGVGDRPPASACASAARGGGACRNYLKRALADRRQPPSPSPSPSLSPHDDSDSSEELRYGPGIVNRLRTKYLSMTLRDNAKKGVRPSLSTLRKATSLDNLVDEQQLMDAEYGGASVVSCRVSEFEYGGGCGGESRVPGDAPAADLKRARSMETLQEDRSPKVARCYENGSPALADEQRREELPPADVVKETLKIFENGGRSPPAWKRSRSAKPCGKPVLYPKPATLESRTSASSGPQPQPQPRPRPPVEAKPRTGGGVSGRRPNGVVESAADGERCRSAASSGDAAGPVRPQWALRAAEKLANGDARRVAPLQAGTPAQQQRQQGRESKRADILKPAEALPVRQVGVIRPLVSTVKSAAAAAPLTPREIQRNYINARLNLMQAEKRNAAASQQQGGAGEKRGDGDGIEHRVAAGATGAAKPSALWCQQAWNQHHNTVVFNFSDRKDVPDYIENDGLLFTAGRDRAKVSRALPSNFTTRPPSDRAVCYAAAARYTDTSPNVYTPLMRGRNSCPLASTARVQSARVCAYVPNEFAQLRSRVGAGGRHPALSVRYSYSRSYLRTNKPI